MAKKEIRNVNDLIAYINQQLSEIYDSEAYDKKTGSPEATKLEYALVEIEDALYHRDIHRLLECRNKYAPK